MHMSAKNNIESIYRLTPMQQGLLFHTLYKADDAAIYLQQLTWTIHKTLVPATFQQAWDAIVSRHPSLRTFFLWEGRKEPIQIVCRRLRVPWKHHDWSGMPAPNQ